MSPSLSGLDFAGLSDVGLHRATNQDSYYLSQAGDLFIVADGMGGHTGGQEASRLATAAISSCVAAYKDSSDISSPALLERAVLAANEAILREQRQHPERADMGTTVVVVMLRDRQFWCAHVGDSRLYQLAQNELSQITQDHTWVAQAQRAGNLTAEQLLHHSWRHVLSQCVGRADLHQIDTQRLKVQRDDRLLLCSDGLTEELTDAAIAAYLQSAPACKDAVIALIEAAKEKGGRDNITVVALSVS